MSCFVHVGSFAVKRLCPFFFRIVSALLICCAGCAHDPKSSAKKRGMVCFTFDDGLYRQWLPQMNLFHRYGATATFFYSGEITAEAAESMRILRANGHSIGLHTVSHKDCGAGDMQGYFDREIRPQLDAAAKYGVTNIRYFAYPNNRHTPESDRFLGRYFSRFRAGLNVKLPKGFRIAAQDCAFIPLSEIPGEKVLGGCGIGEYYLSTPENLDEALTRAAEENKLIVFFSHGISPGAKHVHMPQELLEHLLAKASELQMRIVGFDELPECSPEND